MPIPKLIADKRREQKLSQTELAQAAGLSLNVIRSLEAGKDTASIKNLKKVLALFGLELTTQVKSS